MIIQNVAALPTTGKKVGYICYLTTESEPYMLVSVSPYTWEKLGSTELSWSVTGTTISLTSSTGNSVTIPAATASAAGLLTATLYNKLLGLEISNNTDLNTAADTTTAPSQFAVKSYVAAQLATRMAGALINMGGYQPVGAATTPNTPALQGTPNFVQNGYTWIATSSGTFYGEPLEAGDMLIAKTENPTTLAGWTIVNKNIPAIVTGTQSVAGLLRIGSGTAGDVDVAAQAYHGHNLADSSATHGFMSWQDKLKLDGISPNATAYTHPTSGVGAGTYKSVTVNTLGHVTGGTNPTTLAGYGITDAAPLSHVATGGSAHLVATQSVAGFLSAADKTKLDGIAASANNYSHPTGDGNLHVPATGTTNNAKVLTAGATAGSLSWVALAAASATIAGMIELATQAEVDTGTDAVRAVTPATLAGRGFARKYVTTIASSATSIAVNHALNTRDVLVQAYYLSNYEHVECDVVATDVNNVTLAFATAPAAGSIRVAVIG